MSESLEIVICRTCITECDNFKSLYKKGFFLGELTTLSAVLTAVTGIIISPEDYLSRYICLQCVDHLTSSYMFRKMAIEADENLRAIKMFNQLRLSAENNIENATLKIKIPDTDCFSSEKYKEATKYTQKISQNLKTLTYFQISKLNEQNGKSNNTIGPVLKAATDDNALQWKIKTHQNLTERNKKKREKFFNSNWRCQVCGKQLSHQHSFKYHMQLHSNETPYMCSVCGESFKTRNSYEGHLVLHDPNNPNSCLLCGKSYRQPSSLRTHMLTHTGEKPFRCSVCGKGMSQKSGFKKHMLVHTGEKPHECDICGRKFRYSSNLIAHKRYHTGEKPYQCQQCGKCFPTQEQIKRHGIVHIKDRPYKCHICSKAFKRRSTFVTHNATHDTFQNNVFFNTPKIDPVTN